MAMDAQGAVFRRLLLLCVKIVTTSSQCACVCACVYVAGGAQLRQFIILKLDPVEIQCYLLKWD